MSSSWSFSWPAWIWRRPPRHSAERTRRPGADRQDPRLVERGPPHSYVTRTRPGDILRDTDPRAAGHWRPQARTSVRAAGVGAISFTRRVERYLGLLGVAEGEQSPPPPPRLELLSPHYSLAGSCPCA